MLVAPLMIPIFGMSLSLTIGHNALFGRASLAESMGVALAVGLGGLVGKMVLEVEFGSELLARTNPTPYDIVVALAAGAVGAFSMIDEHLSATLPGVAISTSLVPPLATCGLCLSQGRYDLAGGAFLLFFANFLAIQIASAAVFLLFGFSGAVATERLPPIQPSILTLRIFVKRFFLSLLLLFGVTIFMTHTLYNVVNERRFYRQLEAVLTEELHQRTGARLTEVHYERGERAVNVVAIVLTPQEFAPADAKDIEHKLQGHFHDTFQLIIRSLLSKDTDDQGPVFVTTNEQKPPSSQVKTQAWFLSEANRVISEQLTQVAGARLIEVRFEDGNGPKTVVAVIRTPAAITPAQVKDLQAILREHIDLEARLVTRSILTRDADAERYLYDEPTVLKKELISPALTGEALAFHQQLDDALKRHIARVVAGASLSEFRYARHDQQLHVLAVVRTPQNFTPEQIHMVQTALQDEISSQLNLVIRSVVGIDVDTRGYLSSLDENLFKEQ